MLLIAVSYRRCGRNLRAKLYTVTNSLSAKYAGLTTLDIACRKIDRRTDRHTYREYHRAGAPNKYIRTYMCVLLPLNGEIKMYISRHGSIAVFIVI